MNVSLVSNTQTWELNYEDNEQIKFNRLEKGFALILSAIIWPAFVILAPINAAYQSNIYYKSGLKQSKFVEILGNEKQLKEYAISRITNHKRKLVRLKEKVATSIEKHLRKNNQGPQGGTVKLEFLLKCIDLPSVPEQARSKWLPKSNRLSNDYWKNLNWEDYLSKDFFAISKKARGTDKDICKTLHVFQLKYKTLLHQNNDLTNCNETKKLEITRKIAELSFVKYGIKKQVSKNSIITPFIWALPTGSFWHFFYSSINDRLLFDRKKEHLDAVPELRKFGDLVEAHNDLIKNHDYLIPYREKFTLKGW